MTINFHNINSSSPPFLKYLITSLLEYNNSFEGHINKMNLTKYY